EDGAAGRRHEPGGRRNGATGGDTPDGRRDHPAGWVEPDGRRDHPARRDNRSDGRHNGSASRHGGTGRGWGNELQRADDLYHSAGDPLIYPAGRLIGNSELRTSGVPVTPLVP